MFMLVVWLGLLFNSSSAAAVSVDVTFFADGACSTPFAGTPKKATAESGKCVEMKRGGDGAFLKVVMEPDMKTVLIDWPERDVLSDSYPAGPELQDRRVGVLPDFCR